jgi:hypothetical protein
MAEATNAQMQQFCDQRLRTFAELLWGLFEVAADHRSLIDDPYARAVSNSRWSDARTDGPPHLLQSGNSASPDDLLNFNTALALIEKFRTGTFASVEEANSFAANWAVLQDARVN